MEQSIPYYCQRPHCKGKVFVEERTPRTEQREVCVLCGRTPGFVPRTPPSEAVYRQIEAGYIGLDILINHRDELDAYTARWAAGWARTAERAAKKETEENA
jgi:hypothetical protein